MPTRNVTDEYVQHALTLIRVANQQSSDVTAELRSLARNIRRILLDAGLSDGGRRELRAALSEIADAIGETYSGLAASQTAMSERLVAFEARWAARGGDMGAPATGAALERARTGLLVMGNTLDEHWEAQAQSLMRKISAEVRLGLLGSLNDSEIAARVTGAARTLTGGVLDDSRRQARALVDSTVHAAADAGRRATMESNGINALRWHAILDPKVCPSCGVRAGKLWAIDGTPLGHSIAYASPPLHPNCRCLLLPQKFKNGPPQEGDAKQETFDKWLERMPSDRQEEVLGQGRADLWRRGLITTNDLIGQNGLVMSLSELEASLGP